MVTVILGCRLEWWARAILRAAEAVNGVTGMDTSSICIWALRHGMAVTVRDA